MPGRLGRWVLWGLAGLALLGVAFGAGFLTSWFQLPPFHELAARVESKFTRVAGGPTEAERRLARIETTFLRLSGTVYPMPDNDWSNGGALAVWGEDLLVLHKSGRILRFVAGEGLVDTGIGHPDAGFAAYEALAASAAYAEYSHKPNKLRFNDLTHVDDAEAGLRGLVLSYTFFDPERVCYGSRVAWLDLAAGADPATLQAAPGDWEVIFETAPCLELNPGWVAIDGMMAGGRMAYRGAGRMVLAVGDYHLDGVYTYDGGLQSDATDYSKVIEIDLVTRQARHLSKGHRNPQGVAVDGQGRIWVVEHGVRGGDELNLIREGANYGWPEETLGTLYSGQPYPTKGAVGRHLLHEPPVFAWLPSAAVSSLTTIDGFDPTWDGDLLAGSLSSPAFGQSLFHIRIRDGRALFVERIELEERVRYVTQFGDRIAVWTDRNHLILFSVEPRLDPLADVTARLKTRYDATTAAQIERQLGACAECHSYVESEHASAPSLNGVVGRRVGDTGYRDYSDAMAGHGGVWDAATLRAYLLDPQAVVPGTSMPDPGVSEGAVLDGLIWALENIDTDAAPDMTYN